MSKLNKEEAKMSVEMKKYPKIGQLKDVLYEAKRRASFVGMDDDGDPIYVQPEFLPVLEFSGTVKLHGTNAAVRFDWNEGEGLYSESFQSRNRVITFEDDNMGFVAWCLQRRWCFLLDQCLQLTNNENPESVVVYGEFCGENIQSNVALTQLPKMFVIFGVLVDDEWINISSLECEVEGVYSIEEFPTYSVIVDCNKPENVQNEIVNLVESVESRCPVAHVLGADGIGEGIVWKCITEKFTDLMFKSKGEKHSKTKVKTLGPVDAERIGKVRAFAETAMTEERLNQGIAYLVECNMEIHRKNLGAYLKYVVSDCIAEEKVSMIEQGIEPKELGKHLSEVARRWFFSYESDVAA